MAPFEAENLATWPEAELDEAALMAALEDAQRDRSAERRSEFAELAAL